MDHPRYFIKLWPTQAQGFSCAIDFPSAVVVNGLPAESLSRRLQVKSGVPKGVLRKGVAPAFEAEVDIVPERSERDAVHFGYGVQAPTRLPPVGTACARRVVTDGNLDVEVIKQ